jgi:RNA polymerase sigma factor (sigma-70 family)
VHVRYQETCPLALDTKSRQECTFRAAVERAGMDDNDAVSALVAAAGAGDQAAWNELVDRYTPLLISVIRRFRLTTSEAEDVAQTVWLRLVEHLGSLREPRALPMWLITTGKRESIRLLGAERRTIAQDPLEAAWHNHAATRAAWADPEPAEPAQGLIEAERRQALLSGLAELTTRQRQLLVLLVQDPPLSYLEISQRTGIPVGAIGPTRARAVARLRRTASVQSWNGTSQDNEPRDDEPRDDEPRQHQPQDRQSQQHQAQEQACGTGRVWPA